MKNNYIELSEISGQKVSKEQIQRMYNRYYWAKGYCEKKYVLEVASGSCQGSGVLQKESCVYSAGDVSLEMLKLAKKYYIDRIKLYQFDGQYLPLKDKSMDVIILFEAIYYLPDAHAFYHECKRVLKKGGVLLISTANKDLYDFNPSPHSYAYFGVEEFKKDLSAIGFSVKCFGDTPINKISLRQKILRPIKKMAVTLNIIPKTMSGKKILKRIIFGKMIIMPPEIELKDNAYQKPEEITNQNEIKNYKVIYCEAKLIV